MARLFERDYQIVYDSEIEERDRIEAEVNGNREHTFGKKNCFRKYPKAIRHSESLFPNNYMDIVLLEDVEELEKQCNEFEELLSDATITELNIKRFIQNNKYYHIPASIFKRFSFGHHEAVLFKEFQLGTSYKADYLLAGRASGGWQFIYVEFEKPYGSITIKDGGWGTTVRSGLSQIEDWKTYLEANYPTVKAEFEKHTNKPLPKEFTSFDSSRIHYVVVAGRRKDFDNNEKNRLLQRRIDQQQDIKIIHYDNLLDDARALIGENSY